MHVARAAAATAVLSLTLPASPAGAAEAQTRYSLANGCFTLQDSSGRTLAGAESVRMQATALGRYLLYRPDGTFLAAHAGGGVRVAAEPSPAADWSAAEGEDGTFTLSPVAEEGRPLVDVRFQEAGGCAAYPEAELNATGAPSKGELPYGRLGGLVEGHMHWMTFEYLGKRFHCGRPWHEYGITHALPDCADIEGPQGLAAPVQNVLNYGNPAQPHDTRGYPKLTAWSAGNLTYEGTYWRWIERSWMAGLRLMVMGVNENRALCQLQANRETNCNEMDTMRRGFRSIRTLQDYVDAQAGGPGKGFFQIVTDPFEARRVINDGKMAVVLEIETSEPFDCRGWDTPSCDREQIDRQLDEMYRLGVRSSLLLNKFDNPLTGVRFDAGPVGAVINAGNRESSGSFFSARTCAGPLRDNEIETFAPPASSALHGALSALGVQSGTLPAYPPAPHCNTRGLTALGKHVIRRMMDLKMIVNPDHMSQAAVDDTLSLLEARRYSGVISPHGWVDPGNWPRLWKLGGMAFPGHSAASDYVEEWRRYRPRSTPFEFGWGYGADLGGLSQQPRAVRGSGDITYPFKSYDGSVTFERQTTGERTFDYTKEGVAHYGLYAEWFEDLRRLGGDQMARDMWNGAEAYVQMWERAHGIRRPGCSSPRAALRARGLARVRLGDQWESVLRRAGQPQQRSRAWSWCVRGRGNRRAADIAVLDDAGKVELVGSTARGRAPAGIPVGTPVARLRTRTRPAGQGIRTRRAGGVTWVFVVRGGRVRGVAVASRSLARRPAALQAAVRHFRLARAAQRRPAYAESEAEREASGEPTGRALAGTGNEELNRKLELLCRLQMQS